MKTRIAVAALHPLGIALLVAGLVPALGLSFAHAAQGGLPAQVAALQEDVQTLQQQVRRLIDHARVQDGALAQLTAVVNSQSALINQLQQQNQALKTTLGCMSKTGDDVYFTGCNVHVLSGSGSTDGPVNGLGNLIIGYNEDASALPGDNSLSQRGGSHNLVVGPGHSYTSYGGLVAGRTNTLTAPNATVSGGVGNTASGAFASVSGGRSNSASGDSAAVSGGESNRASDVSSSVSGGLENRALGPYGSVSGGGRNCACDFLSSVSGGFNNSAGGTFTSVSGGRDNVAAGNYSSVSGGGSNIAGHPTDGFVSSVSGGFGNLTTGSYSSVSGGQNRTAPGDFDWAAGGLIQDF